MRPKPVFHPFNMPCTAVLLALLASSMSSITAFAQTAEASRPAYGFLRWQENWSVLANSDTAGEDPFDSVKYVELGSGGSSWASFGGDFRVRVENWGGFNFGTPVSASHEDTFTLTRFRTHADFHLPDSNRFFFEIKGAYASDRNLPGGVRSIDEDKFELQQFFYESKVDLGSEKPVTVRLGRQQFAFGAQRLVSALPWANALRTWDGARVTADLGNWNFDVFGAAFVPIENRGIGEKDSDQMLFGIYGKRVVAGTPGGLEVYALRNEFAGRNFNGASGEDRRWTIGTRKWAPLTDKLDYEVELSYQFGDIGSGDVSAWSVASKITYQATDDKSVLLWGGFDWASGDDKVDGDSQTFNQLYPLGHAYFGIADVIGRQNILDTSFGATWKAMPKFTVIVAAHSFWADSTADAIYNAGGGVVRSGGSYQSSDIGIETDVTCHWAVSRHLTYDAGYAHFFPGDAIDESGPAEHTDFLYLGGTFTF